MKKFVSIFIAMSIILLASMSYAIIVPTYYFVGDHDDGPLTITFDPDDFNPWALGNLVLKY